MKDEFIPPIRSRTTDELVRLVSEPSKWQSEAVKIAEDELDKRDVKPELIDERKRKNLVREKFENLRKKKASYEENILDFVLFPVESFLTVIFDSDLEKEGYTLLAKQRKTILKWLGIIALLIVVIIFVTGS